MSQIASKNLYELLGNDPELDPNREPEPPTSVLDKPVQRTGKRNAGGEAPVRDAGRTATGGRGGSQATFAKGDQAGTLNNRAEKRDDGLRQDRHRDRLREPRDARQPGDRGRGARRGGRGEGRGAPGGTRHVNRDDRKSHTGREDHEKQAAHGWGSMQDGQAEWTDEKAGEAIARAEAKNDAGFTPDNNANDPAFADGPNEAGEADVPAEPEDKSKSYDEYLAELAEKRLQLSGENLAIRKPNEGSKQKFPEGKAFERAETEYFAGSGGKNKREKEQKAKDLVTLDTQYYAPAEQDRPRGGRGGRGGPRGRSDRGRGGRGGRGDRGDRSEGGRGGPRGGAENARGAPRGGAGKNINVGDASAFPALGA
ncbi:hypothetical protein K431DRAFT_287816 [Polychaeton citri CBS 116435]|uniref:Hyaluronan/mRNA-binding protein domain-containing protein n=1 Tax=Polychaeton citri CBS 116435 TaxID=1314669 RepID=A0A9P4Q2H1_9PEZI|nr:hypothetical protein K431DRAFT_287816 [Polychaeton citri CBS 116435]